MRMRDTLHAVVCVRAIAPPKTYSITPTDEMSAYITGLAREERHALTGMIIRHNPGLYTVKALVDTRTETVLAPWRALPIVYLTV
jgi:hypothetical protein